MPKWWLELLNTIVRAQIDAGKTTLTALGVSLARYARRSRPWDHGSVGRFLRGQTVTREMAEAFAGVLPIPGFIFRARSVAEALEMQGVAGRYDYEHEEKLMQMRQRLDDADRVREQHRTGADRQAAALPSPDGKRGPRPGRRSRRAV